MKKYIKSILALTLVCGVMAVILAVTNSITSPIIKQNENATANKALLIVMPEGEGFEEMDISGYTLPTTVTKVYKETSGKGYVLQLLTSGYGSDMVIMCGINADGVVTGAQCLSSSETLGYEKTYGESMVGKNAEDIDSVATISTATLTTTGYKNAIKDALNAVVILGGGTADLRTPEQIFNDNLTNALPSSEGKFTKLFVAEKLDNQAEVYISENSTGYVFVVGEEFIGVDATGTVITKGASVDVSADAQRVATSTMEEIDISAYELPSHVKKVYKTGTGNYVFDLGANGYGINGEWHTSGKQIEIKVSVSPSGEIISCQTIAQYESENVGDVCATPEYYTQFNGKTQETYTDVATISGATVTTKGYSIAIKNMFEALNIIEGEAQ